MQVHDLHVDAAIDADTGELQVAIQVTFAGGEITFSVKQQTARDLAELLARCAGAS